MANDTTGQIVVACDNNLLNPALYEDTGKYPGCRPELNVRGLRLIRKYPHLSDSDIPAMSRDGYGCGWSTTKLHSVTTDEITALAAMECEKANAVDARRARNAAAERAETADRKANPDQYPCPRCGTYCYGDCAERN